ncbi:hypothetical protein [Streptomyces nitrosporeus]|uniref:hypothetical protein n=1 Tax=Streptomyces nitrosporeus TaxID=28894 RepID=UPI00167C520D|nr:hypothetical protein [Streptomyces nitrosporeus]GGZ18070.1 hypothetical protein GCM10010327_56370 [Streptomyces nitrosporeus]
MSAAMPGRPAIGPKVPINFPAGLLEDIETGASLSQLSRAAWIRRAAARALPEVFDGALAPDDMLRFLSTAERGAEPDQEVDDATIRRLLTAADRGTLTIQPFTAESLTTQTPGERRQLSFVTRSFLADGARVVLYQVAHGTITYRQPGEHNPSHHGEHTLYLDQAAARAWHQELREQFLPT